jgi:hypothetical protein
MNSPDEPLDSIHHDLRILRAFLRSEELRRERFLREIEAVREWQPKPGESNISRWIAEVTLQRWQEELDAVDRSIALVKVKLREVTSLLPPGAARSGQSQTEGANSH